MKKTVRLLLTFFTAAFLPATPALAEPALSFTKLWTYNHSVTPNFLAEIPAFDHKTNTLWISGVMGVDLLMQQPAPSSIISTPPATARSTVWPFTTGSPLSPSRPRRRTGIPPASSCSTTPRRARWRMAGTSCQWVRCPTCSHLRTTAGNCSLRTRPRRTIHHPGLPFPTTTARARTPAPRHRSFSGSGPNYPAGSVTIIDVHSRTVIATAGFAGVPVTGPNVRTTTGMDFEPEYITVSHDDHTAYVTLQDANAIGVLDLKEERFHEGDRPGRQGFQPARQRDRPARQRRQGDLRLPPSQGSLHARRHRRL